ncbi:MAG: hypothetical protein HY706_05930 [Candidatus Hydrogenedentes bacterium]|nr:hypothetical protein [Candidatus Hydrogenedentota bacterium]
MKKLCRDLGPTLIGLAIVGTISLWGVCAVAAEEAGDMAPLKIELPRPIFGGTPLNYDSPNLEISYKARPPFPAPKGATNVAKGKPVGSSVKQPTIGKLEQITDGDKEGVEDSVVTLDSGVQYVQIDLQAVHEIYAVVVWHFHAYDRVYYDVVLQVADEPEFKQNVRTVFNNDYDNSSGLGEGKDKEFVDSYEGKLIDTKGVKGRHVRLYSKGNTTDDMNTYIEVEVYGKPAS